MDWKAFWTRFRNTVSFRFLYLVLITVLSAFLLVSGFGCLSLLFIPILMLLVPYSFGEKRLRNHAVNGVFVVLLIPVVYAFMVTPNLVTLPQLMQGASAGDLVVEGGHVTPFNGTTSTSFNFTVSVSTDRPDADQLKVYLQMFDYPGIDTIPSSFLMTQDGSGDGNLSDGEDYYVNVTLSPVLHLFFFQVVNATDAAVATTNGSWGPFNAPYDTYLATIWVRSYVPMLVVAFGFYLFLMAYWWTQKARRVRGARPPPEAKRAEGGGEFTCTNCGADVSEGDAKCPKCGAVFEPEAEREPAEAKA